MALPPLATPTELGDWLGVTFAAATPQLARAEAVLAHASTAVRVEAGRNWVDAEGVTLVDVPLGIAEIVVEVAARKFANPTGAKSTTTGPFATNLGPLDLTDGEKAAIQRAIDDPDDSAVPGLYTIGLTGGDFATGTVYLDVSPAGEKIPYLDSRDVV